MEQQIDFEQPLTHELLAEFDAQDFIDEDIPKSWNSNQESVVDDERELYWDDDYTDYDYREMDFYGEYHYDRWAD